MRVDEEIYKQACNAVQNLIRKTYFEGKLKENMASPKKPWKTFKQIGLPEKKITLH